MKVACCLQVLSEEPRPRSWLTGAAWPHKQPTSNDLLAQQLTLQRLHNSSLSSTLVGGLRPDIVCCELKQLSSTPTVVAFAQEGVNLEPELSTNHTTTTTTPLQKLKHAKAHSRSSSAFSTPRLQMPWLTSRNRRLQIKRFAETEFLARISWRKQMSRKWWRIGRSAT